MEERLQGEGQRGAERERRDRGGAERERRDRGGAEREGRDRGGQRERGGTEGGRERGEGDKQNLNTTSEEWCTNVIIVQDLTIFHTDYPMNVNNKV